LVHQDQRLLITTVDTPTLEDFAASSRRAGRGVYLLRGERCGTRDSLFHEWAAALQFPYYFGWNWDAFEECLHDLDWLGTSALTLAVSNAPELLNDEPSQLPTLYSILGGSLQERERGVDVRVLLQADGRDVATIADAALHSGVSTRVVDWLEEAYR
jgi:hypothetical protein